MHCFESMLHPPAFYFYSSSSLLPQNPDTGVVFCVQVFTVKKLRGSFNYKSHWIALARVADKKRRLRPDL